MMTTELEAAIERVKRARRGGSRRDIYAASQWAPEHAYRIDVEFIASAHIAHLDAEAERKRERAELVTAGRLKALGFLTDDRRKSERNSHIYIHDDMNAINIELSQIGDDWFACFVGSYEVPITNIGQVLDLLAALKGEA